MAYRLGAGSWLAAAEESTWGTAATTGFLFYKPSPGDEDLSLTHEVIEVDSIAEGRGMSLEQNQKGYAKVEGTVGMNVRFDGAQGKIFGLFMSHLLQETATTAGTDPYTHTWDFDYTSAQQGKGITLVSYRDGDIGSKASDDARQFVGCRPTSVDFSFEQNGIVRAEFSFVGKTATWASASSLTVAFGTGEYAKLPSSASSPTAFCQAEFNRSDPDSPSYTAIDCRSGSLRIEQASFEERSLQSANPSGLHYEDRLLISGSLELQFQGTGTGGDDVSKAFPNQEQAALKLTVEGATPADASLVFDLHSCLATSPSEAHADEIGTLYQSFEFKALRALGETVTTEGSVVLTNTNSTSI